ncbi:MAG: 4Fe-4S binding protein [Oscillospiraceae bacterium]|nr:4Fe-4S binding protein [Oscillospiraceae bacterium]
MCERVCSGNAITTVVEKTEEGDKVTRTFNLGSCTFCATCMDFCHGAIEFSGDYHMIATKEEDLLVVGTHFRKPPAKKPAPPKPAPAPAPDAEKPAGEAKPEAPAEQAAPAVQPRDDGKPVQDASKCVYCTICAKKCPVGALEVDRAAKTWKLDEDLCVGCGTCAGACPKKCIIM